MSYDKQQLPPLYPNGTFNQPKKYEKYNTLPPSHRNHSNKNLPSNPLQNHTPYQGIPGFDRDYNNNNNTVKNSVKSSNVNNNSTYVHPNTTIHNKQSSYNHQSFKRNFNANFTYSNNNPPHQKFTPPNSSSSSDPQNHHQHHQRQPSQSKNNNITFSHDFSILSLLNKYSNLITSQSSQARQLSQALLVYHQSFHYFLEAKSKLFDILKESYQESYPDYENFSEAVDLQKNLCEKTMQTLSTRSHRALIQRTSSYLNQFPVAIKSLRLAIDTVRKNDELQERLQKKLVQENQAKNQYKNIRHTQSSASLPMNLNEEQFSELKIKNNGNMLPETEVFELLKQLPGLYDCRIQMLASTVGEIVDLERKLFGQLFTHQGKIAPIICELERQFQEGKLKSKIHLDIKKDRENLDRNYNGDDFGLNLLRDWKERREAKNDQKSDHDYVGEDFGSIRPEDSISNIEPNLTESEVAAIERSHKENNGTVIELKPEKQNDNEFEQNLKNYEELKKLEELQKIQNLAYHDTMRLLEKI